MVTEDFPIALLQFTLSCLSIGLAVLLLLGTLYQHVAQQLTRQAAAVSYGVLLCFGLAYLPPYTKAKWIGLVCVCLMGLLYLLGWKRLKPLTGFLAGSMLCSLGLLLAIVGIFGE